MIDERQLHLYAVARTAIPIGQLLRVMAEPTKGHGKNRGIMYTLEVRPEEGNVPPRWLAVHSSTLDDVDDRRLRLEIEQTYSGF